MGDNPSFKQDSVEALRAKAFNFASNEQIGNAATRAIELMQIVMKSGVNSPNVKFLVKSLEMEGNMLMKHDDRKSDSLRDLMYSFCAALGRSIESVEMEKEKESISSTATDTDSLHTNESVEESDHDGGDSDSSDASMDGSDESFHASEMGDDDEEEEDDDSEETESEVAAAGTAAAAGAAGTGFKCDKCDLVLATIKGFKNHMESKCNMKCGECSAVLRSLAALVQHRKLQHGTAAEAAAVAALEFECTLCEARFKNAHTRRDHLLLHERAAADAASDDDSATVTADNIDEAFKCNKCNHNFSSARRLQKHTLTLCGTRCADCGLAFQSATAMLQHRKLQHGTAAETAAAAKYAAYKFDCELCGAKFKTRRIYRNHKLIHTGKMFPCAHCDMKVGCESALNFHMRKAHGLNKFECPNCNEKFDRADELKKHIAVHYEEDPSATATINKSYKSDKSLQREMRCPLCENGYHNLKSLLRHLELSHKTTAKRAGIAFRCDCGHVSRSHSHEFCQIANFTVIRADESGSEAGSAATAGKSAGKLCEKCGTEFFNASGYRKHMETLCGTRCRKCLMVFKSDIAMTQHQKLQHPSNPAAAAAAAEIATRPFACEECGARFKKEAVLNNHLAVHKDKGFTCDVCDKGFYRETELKRHKKKAHAIEPESAENRFLSNTKCRDCGMEFKSQMAMRQHRKLQHGTAAEAAAVAAGRFPCNQCEAKFTTAKAQRLHMIRHDLLTKSAVVKKEEPDDDGVEAENSATDTTAAAAAAEAPDGEFKCDKCDRTFISALKLEVHTFSLCNTKCCECGLVFKSSSAMQQHRKLQHGPAADAAAIAAMKYECEECGQRFKSAGKRRDHVVKHKLASSTNEELSANQSDVAVTGGVYECYMCHKSFSGAAILKKHVHTLCGTRCGECLMVYKSTTAMMQHDKLHHSTDAAAFKKTNRFECKKCEARFKTPKTLQTHMAHHSSDRFSCEICNREFTLASALKFHKKTAHGTKEEPDITP